VNIYANLPASDHGKGMCPAFGHVVADGPVGLSLHAIVGTLLLITGITAVVRAAFTRSPLSISPHRTCAVGHPGGVDLWCQIRW